MTHNECVGAPPLKGALPLKHCFVSDIFRAKKLLFWYLSHVRLGSRVAGLPCQIGFVNGRRRGLWQASSSSSTSSRGVSRKLDHVLQQAATTSQAYGGQLQLEGISDDISNVHFWLDVVVGLADVPTYVVQNLTVLGWQIQCQQQKYFWVHKLVWRILLVGGVSVSVTNGGIVSCIWTLARWSGPAQVYSRPDLFGFQIADFKITCIASFFSRNMLMQIHLYSEVRWDIVMKIMWRENLFPNTAKLLVSVQQTYGIIW